jgi:alcohol dehydrogenase
MMEELSTQKLLLTAPRRLQWITEKLPPLGAHEVLIQTRTGAMSIGSELPVYCGTARTSKPLSYPRMTGYESVGIVTACGSDVKTVQVGNRVVSFYGHSTHAVVPEAKVIKIPDTISDLLAILTILTCDTAKGVRKMAPMPEERALITGAGTMGLLTLFVLKAYGLIEIDVVEPRQERHALASQLGARTVYFPHDLPPTSESYSIAFECSSRNEAFTLLQNHMQQNGRICILADGNLEPLVLTPAFHERELHIVGSSDGWDYHKHAVWYFQVIQQNDTGLEQIFEEEIMQSELISTFERLANERARPVKILVHYEP